MKTTINIFLILLIAGHSTLFAQPSRQLKVGDTIPDLTVRHLWQKGDQAISLDHFRNRQFLIINFWATWCAPCVKELKMLSALTAKDQTLNVLSVSYETDKQVAAFLKNNSDIAGSRLQIVTADTLLAKYFYHQSLPHNVWVDRSGVIRAITGGEEMNAENVRGFLKGDRMDVKTKTDEPFDMYRPLHIPDSLLQFRSIFSTNLKNVHLSGAVIDPAGTGYPHMKLMYGFNQGIVDLLYAAYLLPGYTANDYTYEIHTSDSSRFFFAPHLKNKAGKGYKYYSDWAEDNCYCYELRTAGPVDDSIFSRHAVSDLELNLHVRTRMAYRDKVCCVVTSFRKLSPTDTLGNRNKRYFNIEGNRLVLRNVSIDQLLAWLVKKTYKAPGSEDSYRKEPYVNETGLHFTISGVVDLGNADPKNYSHHEFLEQCISKSLGLNFRLKTQPYKTLIITDQE